SALVQKDSFGRPSTYDHIQPARHSRRKSPASADWEFVQHVREEHVLVVEVGKGAIEKEIVNVCWRAAEAGAAQAASSRCCRGVHRHIVDRFAVGIRETDRKSTRLNSSHVEISYAVFCLKKKKIRNTHVTNRT